MKNPILCLVLCISAMEMQAQKPELFGNLTLGEYPVGFKVITITDRTRFIKPALNYLGEKDTSNRNRKINLQIWYPARGNKQRMKLEEYCFSHFQSSFNEILSDGMMESQMRSVRTSIEGYFGKIDDRVWRRTIAMNTIAMREPLHAKGKFPLLVGMLRPFSTTITNEYLASHGFIVIMIRSSMVPASSKEYPVRTIEEVEDMRKVVDFAVENEWVDEQAVGTFGFSGAGFSQILYAMQDYRLKAVADLESGLFMEGLFQRLSSSNYYDQNKIRIPFLHIFSKDLSQQEKYISAFENMKFAKRYQLLLNQPALHHWDFATEGMLSCTSLGLRGEKTRNIQSSFELANIYLLRFFEAELKGRRESNSLLSGIDKITGYEDSLYSIKTYAAIKPAPGVSEFQEMVSRKGIEYAINMFKETIKNDSSTALLEGFILNRIGNIYLAEDKRREAIAIFSLNKDLHPNEINWYNPLADALAAAGRKEEAISTIETLLRVIDQGNQSAETKNNLKRSAEEKLNKLKG